ncbi:MAG: hypothetical protein QXZ02_02800 [Candidatus Bathyarchaeia archaeon]
MKAKYAYLLEDSDVKRWFENLLAKSIVTATVYLRTLGFYCDLNKTDPKAILKVAKERQIGRELSKNEEEILEATRTVLRWNLSQEITYKIPLSM